MKIYLAASYSRRLEMLGYARQLEAIGHKITSTWITGKHETNSKHGADADNVADHAEQAGWAAEDILNIGQGDALMQFTGGGHRGGRHVEFGIALATGKMCFLIGEPENVFHCLPSVYRFPTWEAFLESEWAGGKVRVGYVRMSIKRLMED